MDFLIPLAMYGWIPLVLLLFHDIRGHRAIVIAYLIAWLFLPSVEYPLIGLPDYTKVSATTMGIFLATLLFEPSRIVGFRPHWLDLPIVAYCLAPFPTTFTNQLGLWDGVSNSLHALMSWGIPYFFGRVFFNSLASVTFLVRGIFWGGLIYVPFCLIEMRMSPQIYNWVYGFRETRWHASRYGGWRPIVFLKTGLELGFWMTAACLSGFALWYSGARRREWGLPIGLLLTVLLTTTLFCKSTGALLLLVSGIGCLLLLRSTRSAWPAAVLVVVPIAYIGVRATNHYDGSHVVTAVEGVFGAERAESLQFRFKNEDLIAAKAWQQPLFGQGGWGRARIFNEFGEDQTVVDGQWLKIFGQFGMLGLLAFYSAFMIGPLFACLRFSRREWSFAQVAPTIALSLLLLIYMIDCLMNAMDNPIYALGLGGICNLCQKPDHKLREAPVRVHPPTVARQRTLWPRPAEDLIHRSISLTPPSALESGDK